MYDHAGISTTSKTSRRPPQRCNWRSGCSTFRATLGI
jgi:hypothetical protein